jgi:ketosteroid isomerase-like protein
MKKLHLLLLLTGILISCNQKTQKEQQMEAAMTLYDQNAKAVHALFDSLENEDLETASSFFAEDAKFNPPAYGGKDLNKKEILDNYNGFLQLFNNIKANDRDFYPTVDEHFMPDGGVRIYANWSADLGDNSMKGIKAYEVFKFNENNKIIEVDEYMDVSGLFNKIGELSTE